MNDDRRRSGAPRGKHGSRSPTGFQRLLVAVDLSPISDRVLARTALLPLAEGAHITVLHVVPRGLPPDLQQKARQDAARALIEEKQQLAEALPGRARLETLLKLGDPAREIAAAARALKAELTVLGRGGPRALRDVFIGSTAERVIRRARQPVLAVRGPARTRYQRPAAAVALDRVAPGALAMLAQVISGQRSPLLVLHAVDAPLGRTYPSLTREEAASWRAQVERAAARQLDELLAAVPLAAGSAPHWKPRLRTGSARLVIAEAVQKLDTDLLVLGTHGYSGAAHVLLGTVAGDVLRDVSCDVLLVPGPR